MFSQVRVCLSCGKPGLGSVLLQIANYRAPPLLHPEVIRRVNNELTPFPKSPHYNQPIKEPQYSMEEFKFNRRRKNIGLDNKRRKIWAKFGSASGIDPAVLFQTEQEIKEEIKAEKTWWPSLQHMQKNIKKENEMKQLVKEKRDKKIKENMAKMPKWIAEFQKEQEEIRIKEEKMEEKKMIDLETAQEKFGFKINQNHPSLMQYYEEDKERRKAAKKAEKRLKKLEKKKK